LEYLEDSAKNYTENSEVSRKFPKKANLKLRNTIRDPAPKDNPTQFLLVLTVEQNLQD